MHYTLQIIYSISQLTAFAICSWKAYLTKIKSLYLLTFLLGFSFLQSFLQVFFNNKTYLEYSITAYILVEFFIHSSIIESIIEKKIFIKYYEILKYICIIFILALAISTINYFPDNSWISHIPDILIIAIGMIAINDLVNKSPVMLLRSFEFWATFSFVFIRISLIPIEAIDYLFLNKTITQSIMIWIKFHQYLYLFYHIIIIYSLKWIQKK